MQSRSVRAKRRAGAWKRSSSKEEESASSRFPARSPSAISGLSRAIRSIRARSTAVTSSASSSVKASSGSEREAPAAPAAIASATAGRAHAGASFGAAERRAKAAVRRSQDGAPDSARSRRSARSPSRSSGRRASRRRGTASTASIAAGSPSPTRASRSSAPPASSRARSRYREAGAPGMSASSAQSAPVARGPSVSRRRSCSTIRAAASRVRPLLERKHGPRDLAEAVVEPDGLHPIEAEETAVGEREDLDEGAEGDGLREAPRAVVDLGHGEGLSPVLAVPARGRPDGHAEEAGAPGQDEAGPPLATGVEGIRDEDGRRAVEAHGRVAPRAGEERGDAAGPRPELRGRGTADLSTHLGLRDRPDRDLPVRGDADDVIAPRVAPQDPGLVPEEGGLRAPQRRRRDGGADRAVGEAEDVPGLHLALVAGAGRPATEAVGRLGGDAGARVGHAEDVALVADRERGLLEAPGVAQDEPAGGGLDGPDEPARRHPEARLDPASGRRRRRRPESERGEDSGRQGGEDEPETVSGARHRRETAYLPGRVPVPRRVTRP